MPWTCDLDDEDDRGTAVRELERRDMVVLLAPAPGEIARPATIARGGELSISLPIPRFRGGKFPRRVGFFPGGVGRFKEGEGYLTAVLELCMGFRKGMIELKCQFGM